MIRNRHKSTQQELPSPEQHLREFWKDYPGLVDSVNYFLKGKGKDLPDWPQWCLLPMAAWYAILYEYHSNPMTVEINLARVTAIGT
jgi:hypothetical protein